MISLIYNPITHYILLIYPSTILHHISHQIPIPFTPTYHINSYYPPSRAPVHTYTTSHPISPQINALAATQLVIDSFSQTPLLDRYIILILNLRYFTFNLILIKSYEYRPYKAKNRVNKRTKSRFW